MVGQVCWSVAKSARAPGMAPGGPGGVGGGGDFQVVFFLDLWRLMVISSDFQDVRC